MTERLVGMMACLIVACGGCAVSEIDDTALPRVTLLAEGYVAPIEGRDPLPGRSGDGARRVASSIVLVQTEEAVIVADPGMIADRDVLLDGLREQGVAPSEVTHVFWSHHHPDHTVNTALFPNASVIDFWGVYTGDLWEDHPDDFEFTPGVRVLRTPGHTSEDATLLIKTPEGVYAVTHLWWDENMQPEVDPLADDPEAMQRHRETVLGVADWVIPGHGGLFRVER